MGFPLENAASPWVAGDVLLSNYQREGKKRESTAALKLSQSELSWRILREVATMRAGKNGLQNVADVGFQRNFMQAKDF
jgi:hypothetical protein